MFCRSKVWLLPQGLWSLMTSLAQANDLRTGLGHALLACNQHYVHADIKHISQQKGTATWGWQLLCWPTNQGLSRSEAKRGSCFKCADPPTHPPLQAQFQDLQPSLDKAHCGVKPIWICIAFRAGCRRIDFFWSAEVQSIHPQTFLG